ncbi:DUF1801 domain-containing protein [Henriciella aquimarina]|uniref:DUF1801 domain-containing protein n=1 Tax=Henriciella aquimarina TaxID=545261 RepID=UPI001301ACB7|nr:DUF1801 domain-containing protein [Henriciella aquimarina]
MPKAVKQYFAQLDGAMKPVALALSEAIYRQGPSLKATLAWGSPCWSGHQRVLSVIAHRHHCNLQLWSGVQLAPHYLGRIEGTGKMHRHVKVRQVSDIDDELIDIIDRAILMDQEAFL